MVVVVTVEVKVMEVAAAKDMVEAAAKDMVEVVVKDVVEAVAMVVDLDTAQARVVVDLDTAQARVEVDHGPQAQEVVLEAMVDQAVAEEVQVLAAVDHGALIKVQEAVAHGDPIRAHQVFKAMEDLAAAVVDLGALVAVPAVEVTMVVLGVTTKLQVDVPTDGREVHFSLENWPRSLEVDKKEVEEVEGEVADRVEVDHMVVDINNSSNQVVSGLQSLQEEEANPMDTNLVGVEANSSIQVATMFGKPSKVAAAINTLDNRVEVASNAKWFLLKNARVSQFRNATLFPSQFKDKTAQVAHNQSAVQSVNRCPSSNADLCQNNNAATAHVKAAKVCPSSSAKMFPNNLADQFPNKNVNQQPDKYAPMNLDNPAKMFHVSNAQIMHNKNARMFPSSSARVCPNSSAPTTTSHNAALYPSRNVAMFPDSSARMKQDRFPSSSARMFQAKSASLLPSKFQSSNVRTSQHKSAKM